MGVKTEDFDKLFNELCLSLRNDDRVRTSSAVSSIISYLNFCMMTNYKSVHVTPEGMKKMNQIAFMCALGDKVYYSSDLIIEYSKRIKDKYGNTIRHFRKEYSEKTIEMFNKHNISIYEDFIDWCYRI